MVNRNSLSRQKFLTFHALDSFECPVKSTGTLPENFVQTRKVKHIDMDFITK